MINFDNGGILLQHTRDFPSFAGAEHVYLDFETSSGDPKEDSLNPWQNCYIAGFAITVDDCLNAYYFDNISATDELRQFAFRWLQGVLNSCKYWVNHHVKYDAHVAANNGLIVPDTITLICTIVQAKLIDSDRISRGGYGLDVLSKDWLEKDINIYEKRLAPYLVKNKDYGKIPGDILGEYACQDVLTNRELWIYICNCIPERCLNVSVTEMGVTRELFKCEQRGMLYNTLDLNIAQYTGLEEICFLDDKLKKLTGRTINAKSNDDCYEVLVGQYGLPIIKYTVDKEGEETENASFDKNVLKAYLAEPYAPREVIQALIRIRRLIQLDSLYYTPWKKLAPDGVIHSEYNQAVRTGRMSCKRPNAQQIISLIKSLIIPRSGYAIVSTDASQIEFRLIIHYIQNQAAIQKYKEDPNADFHDLVAEMAHVNRKLGKTINFGTAFGEGKKKLLTQIASDPAVVAEVEEEVSKLNLRNEGEKRVEFRRRVELRASQIYDTYHGIFPELKPTTKLVEQVCKSMARRLGTVGDDRHFYGYITNSYGRDRHLPYCGYRTDYESRDPLDKAWLAFSTLNQSTAADLVKERLVELMRCLYGRGVNLLGVIHDEILLEVPEEIAFDPRFERDVCGILEAPAREFLVPIRWAVGASKENWKMASEKVSDGGCSRMFNYNKNDCENFSWIGV